jgi:hypothetical protein
MNQYSLKKYHKYNKNSKNGRKNYGGSFILLIVLFLLYLSSDNNSKNNPSQGLKPASPIQSNTTIEPGQINKEIIKKIAQVYDINPDFDQELLHFCKFAKIETNRKFSGKYYVVEKDQGEDLLFRRVENNHFYKLKFVLKKNNKGLFSCSTIETSRKTEFYPDSKPDESATNILYIYENCLVDIFKKIKESHNCVNTNIDYSSSLESTCSNALSGCNLHVSKELHKNNIDNLMYIIVVKDLIYDYDLYCMAEKSLFRGLTGINDKNQDIIPEMQRVTNNESIIKIYIYKNE